MHILDSMWKKTVILSQPLYEFLKDLLDLTFLQDFLKILEELFNNSSGSLEQFFKNFQGREIEKYL